MFITWHYIFTIHLFSFIKFLDIYYIGTWFQYFFCENVKNNKKANQIFQQLQKNEAKAKKAEKAKFSSMNFYSAEKLWTGSKKVSHISQKNICNIFYLGILPYVCMFKSAKKEISRHIPSDDSIRKGIFCAVQVRWPLRSDFLKSEKSENKQKSEKRQKTRMKIWGFYCDQMEPLVFGVGSLGEVNKSSLQTKEKAGGGQAEVSFVFFSLEGVVLSRGTGSLRWGDLWWAG